jgi:hypothetical protein
MAVIPVTGKPLPTWQRALEGATLILLGFDMGKAQQGYISLRF